MWGELGPSRKMAGLLAVGEPWKCARCMNHSTWDMGEPRSVAILHGPGPQMEDAITLQNPTKQNA